MTGYPDNNPKTLVGAKKVPLHLIPTAAKHYLAMAMENGANKYGPFNWRDTKISVSTYIAAMQRHIDAYWDGENEASDSGVHHMAHAMACAALILDAGAINMLVDDRPTKGAAGRLQEEYHKNKEVQQNAAKQEPGHFERIGDRDWAWVPDSVEFSGVSDNEADVRTEGAA